MISSVRIAGHTFKVEVVPDLKDSEGTDVAGICNGLDFLISIRESHPQHMRTTLWHELLHAALPELSEKAILSIERATYAVLSDNPDVLPYLVSHARP